MLNAIETYLALRRATGFAMSTAECLLKSFAAFAAERGQTHVAHANSDRLGRSRSDLWRNAMLGSEPSAASCAMSRWRTSGMSCRRPITSARARRRRTPHIYTADEIGRLIEAALRLRPKGGLRPYTYATLIALLSATGLRISEALKLTIADVTSDGLLIRETKFRKTRLVPLHDTAVAGLQRYLDASRARLGR